MLRMCLACAVGAVSSSCPVYFISSVTVRLPPTTLAVLRVLCVLPIDGLTRGIVLYMLLAGESSEIPGRLRHTSFGSRRPSTTTLSQSTLPDCAAALPAEHVWALSGLFGRRSYFVELFTGSYP